jgi:hypothetical protein
MTDIREFMLYNKHINLWTIANLFINSLLLVEDKILITLAVEIYYRNLMWRGDFPFSKKEVKTVVKIHKLISSSTYEQYKEIFIMT